MESTDIFSHCFRNLPEKDIALLKKYFGGYDYQGATYTFLANYIWRKDYDLSWEVIGDYLCMASMDTTTGRPTAIIAMPMTEDGNYDLVRLRETVIEAKRRFDVNDIPFSIRFIPGHMVHLLDRAFPNQMEFRHDRDDDEYVYDKKKLITLSGRALHKKKNHMNFFLKNFSYEAKPITADMLPDIIRLDEIVRKEHERSEEETKSLGEEHHAIAEMMDYLDDPDVYTMAIFIDGKMQAYAIGERMSADTVAEHFEKANIEYRGLYQVICSEFCKSLPEDILFVNREEDMGLPNLRRAKKALRPHHMAEKFSGWFIADRENGLIPGVDEDFSPGGIGN